MDYREGLFLNDIGDGSDAIKLSFGSVENDSGLDIFVLRKGLAAIEGEKNSRDFYGFYSSWPFFNSITIDFYGGYYNSSPWPKWMGIRVFGPIQGKKLYSCTLEGALVKTQDYWSGAYQVAFKYLYKESSLFGLDIFGFGEKWIKPVSYPVLLDYFYNGWTGFGEAMNWVVLALALAPYLSSSTVDDPYALYWPDQHNFHVIDLNVLLTLVGELSVRLDNFSYIFQKSPRAFNNKHFIGNETALNPFYDRGNYGTIGLSIGYFIPSSGLKDAGFKEKAFVIRLWGTVNFGTMLGNVY